MYGTLRFFLAITVALSHFGVTIYSYNPGVISVVVFYLLAGMVAYKLNSRNYPNKPLLYYKDRIKRIFPLYYASLIFAFCVYLLGAKSYFISASPSIIEFLSNIFVIPLSYYMYSGIDKFTLLPPVWSLGVELQFYLIAPFVLMNKKILYVLLIFSLLIYSLSSIGFLNTDYYGYRLLVGVLFIFLLGVLLQKTIEGNNLSKNFLLLVYVFILCLTFYVYFTEYRKPYNYETLYAIIGGIPLLYLLSMIKNASYKKIDTYLGNISYPIFLLHFPVLWLLEVFIYNVHIYYTIVTTLLFSILLFHLEKKNNLF